MMKGFTFLIALLLLTVSCESKRTQNNDIDHLFTTVEKKTTEATAFRTDELVEPVYQLSVGPYLLVGSIFTDPMITVYSLASQKRVKSILSKGKAGNEILQIGSLSLSGDQLICYSTNDQKIAFIDTLCLSKDTLSIQGRQLGDIQGLHCLRFCPIRGGRYVTTGVHESNHPFYLLDTHLNLTTGFDTYPETDNDQALTPTERALGYQGRLLASPDGKYLIYNSSSGCFIKFFDCTDSLPVKIQEYTFEIPRFTGTPDHFGARWDKNNLQGVLSTTADKDYFYLLYSDRKQNDSLRESKIIYVFDHKGAPVRKIELDQPTAQIVYSEYDHSLYLFSTNDQAETTLRKVNLTH